MEVPQRVIMAIMGFFAIAVAYSMRACLSVAITEMVVPLNNTGKGSESLICPADESPTENSTHPNNDGPRYNWTQSQQGYILSSFYLGYFITHIPAGLLAEKFGAKWTLSLGILIINIMTAATPLALEYGGVNALIVLRILMGLAGGTSLPALTTLLAAWVPEKERGKLGSFVLGGSQVGAVLSFYLSGLILSYFPWPMVFYFWSIVSIIWFVLFTLLCYSDPGSHPFISKKERDYLKAEMGQIERNSDLPPTPWKSILTNVPVIALIIGQICHDWVFYIMAADLPKYMKEVLGFSVHDVGLYSSLPYLLMWAVSLLSGFISDFLTDHKFITLTQARKLFTGLASVFPAIFIVVASYANCNRLLVVVSFVLAMGFKGNFYPGMKINSLDLSPNYAGSIMALTNGLGAICGFVAPSFVGIFTPDSSIEQWRFVFWITFGIAMVRTVIFSIWASAEVQPFNDPITKTSPETEQLTRNVERNAAKIASNERKEEIY